MRLEAKHLIFLFFIYFLTFMAVVWVPSASAMGTEDCLGCHGYSDMVGDSLTIDQERFEVTSHAPMGCVACHHTVADTHPDDGIALEKATCRDCHDQIFTEYGGSSHAYYASCNDCHDPHAVLGPTQVSGHDMNRSCVACHDTVETAKSHSSWLPQARLHIEALPCITCHTGSENYVITFYITDTAQGRSQFQPASFDALQQIAGDRDIRSLIDTNEDNYISLAELRAFNINPAYKPLRLQGMMTPETVTHTFDTMDNRWDCSFCHASGPGTMQVSYLSFPEPNGTYARVAVEKGAALDTLFGTPDFYMMGSTRSTALNYIGLAIIAGGLVLPIGHGSLRFLTRKNRKH